jgi:hypothetical protein
MPRTLFDIEKMVLLRQYPHAQIHFIKPDGSLIALEVQNK